MAAGTRSQPKLKLAPMVVTDGRSGAPHRWQAVA